MRKLEDCAADQFEDEELKRPSPGDKPLEPRGLILLRVLRLGGAHAVPEVQRVERAVVRHVAAQGGDGDVARLDGRVVRAVLRRRGEVLLAYPVVSLAARVYVLGDDGARVLDSLPRDAYAARRRGGDVYVEERALRKSFFQNFARRLYGEARRVREVEVVARDEAEGDAGHAENRR